MTEEEDEFALAKGKITKERTGGRVDSKEEALKKEIDKFFNDGVQWDQVLIEQNAPKSIVETIGNSKDEWQLHWQLISEHFDVMRWWESDGRKYYKRIYQIACLILPMPDSNGGQERTATWMDGKLNKRQTEATFQMKVVLHQNADFLLKTRMDFDDRYKAIARRATTALFKSAERDKELRATKRRKPEECQQKIPYRKKNIIPESGDEESASSPDTDILVNQDSETDDSEEEMDFKLVLEPLEEE